MKTSVRGGCIRHGKLLEDISFYASEYDRESFNVTEEYVRGVFKDEEEDYKKDTSKYII